jgi:hypothetical protein
VKRCFDCGALIGSKRALCPRLHIAFAACVGSILRLGPEAQADLMSLPPGIQWQPAAMAEYSDKLEGAFGVWLRQLNCPPISQRPWIAAVRTDTPSSRTRR